MISHRKTPNMRYAYLPDLPSLPMPRTPSKHPAIGATLTAGDLLAPPPTLVYPTHPYPVKAQKFDSNLKHNKKDRKHNKK